MATGDLAARSNNSIDMLTQLLTTFKGGPTTTQTSSEQVSNDKATAYLQQLLGGTSGLAAVSSGQKSAGMYNSTVNQQLTNDLLARTSAQTAALSSTKTSTSQVGPQANPLATIGMMLGGQVASKLAGPALTTAKKKLGLDDLGQKISDSIFGPSGGSAGTGVLGESVSNIYPAAFDTMPINSAALQNLDNLSVTSSGSADTGSASSAGGMDAGTAAALGIGAGTASALAGGTTAATAGGYAIAAGDTAFGLAAGEAAAGAAGAEAAGAGIAGAAGGSELMATLGPIGLGIAAISAIGQAADIKEIPHWIICTELRIQGRMPHKYYRYGGREFMKYDERGKQGYYIWAIPSVRHLRKYPDSAYSKLLEVVFNARAEYLSAVAGCIGARKTVLGFLTTHVLYGVCWILSRTIARSPVSTSQILGA